MTPFDRARALRTGRGGDRLMKTPYPIQSIESWPGCTTLPLALIQSGGIGEAPNCLADRMEAEEVVDLSAARVRLRPAFSLVHSAIRAGIDERLRELVQKRGCQHFFCCRRQSSDPDKTDTPQCQESNGVAELCRNSVPQHCKGTLLNRVEICP